MVRVFANGPGDMGSITGRVIPKTQKMELDATLLNTQHYMVRIKGKVEQSKERGRALHLGVVAIEKGDRKAPFSIATTLQSPILLIYRYIYREREKVGVSTRWVS